MLHEIGIMARHKDYTDEDIIKAIRAKHGMVYLAARSLGCSHTLIYNRLKQNPLIKETIDACRGVILDDAETKLVSAIKRGEPWAIAFTLKTIGKDRGYTERQEVTGANGASLKIEYVNDWRSHTEQTND